MNTRGEFFRREALEFHTRGETSSGSVIRLGAPWLRWSSRLLFALLAVGVAASILLRTDESATGPALVDARAGTFAALLPAAVAPDLHSARALRITLPGGSTVVARVTAALPVPAHTRHAGLSTIAQPGILLSGRVGSRIGRTGRLRGHATAVLQSERLYNVVLRQFQSMLGRTGS